MNIRTTLAIRVHSGQREAAVAAFMQRKVLEECAETVPGYLHGEVLLAVEDPELINVVVQWTNLEAVQQWHDSPVREAQNVDLLRFVAEPPIAIAYEVCGNYRRS